MGFTNKKPPKIKGQRLDELLPLYSYKSNDKKTVVFRFVGEVIAYEQIWFNIKTSDGNITKIPKFCADLDPYTDTYISDDCPFRKDPRGQPSRIYLVNGILRKLQDMKPAKTPPILADEKELIESRIFSEKMRFKNTSSDSWTPVVPVSLTASSVNTLIDFSKENIVSVSVKKNGKTIKKNIAADCTDLDHGFDISIRYNSEGTGTGKMVINREKGTTPITDEEFNYLYYKLDVIDLEKERKTANEEYKKLSEMIVEGEGKKRGRASLSMDDEDEQPETKKKKKSGNFIPAETDDYSDPF